MPRRPQKKIRSPRIPKLETLGIVHPNAAGFDIGSREIWACIPADRDPQSVRCFATFTPDLQRLVAWLKSCQIDTVAMESTGVYWIPIFELLEAHGIHAALIEPRQLKRVPGRKSDILDCQWIQQLHALGLLTVSFRPDAQIRSLRTLLRHRAELVQHRAPHILHMQKAMQQMNLQLHHVLSDITGATGLRILRAIVAGQRDPAILARFRDPACKASLDTIHKALTGTWIPEHLFALQQSLELFDFFSLKITECDAFIESQYTAFKPRWESDFPARLPAAKPNSHSKNQPPPSTRAHLTRIIGVDLVAVDGLSASLAQTILSEIGTDMSRFPTVQHFTSWLGLAPHNDISGGRVLRSRTLPTHNRAGQAFRQAAASVTRSQSAFGAFYRRKKVLIGPPAALVATAHRLARTVYTMLKRHVAYVDIGASAYDRQNQQRELAYLSKKASRLGFTLTPMAVPPNT